MKKKIISLLLCAAMVLSLVPPLTASAEVMTSVKVVTLELGKNYTDEIIETNNRSDDQYTWLEGAVPGLTFTSVACKTMGDYDYYRWSYSGVPTTPGTYEVVMQTADTNGDGDTSRTECIIVVEDQPHESVTHTAFCGEEYSYELKDDEAKYISYYAAAEGLEDTGLSLQNRYGSSYVEGEIDQPGHIPYSVWRLYPDGNYKKYVVDLYATYPRFTASETARTGESFAHYIEIADTYYAGYSNYSVTSGKLPDGIRISDSMEGLVIGGSPTEPGSYVIKLDLNFKDGAVATYTLTLKVECGQHDPEDMWYADGSTHWRFCTICDKGIDEGYHTGGKATCQDKALCDICHEPYGIYGAHDWNGKTCRLCGEVRDDLPFTDVVAGSWYYNSVIWAIENKITNGITATTFEPNGNCLRSHVVTFLHRAAGSPEPTNTQNPFSDVPTNSFYYKPVLWAVEKGITNGINSTTFGSMSNCNRGAVVTFLWRAQGSPEPESTEHPFVDVNPNGYYYKAVLWAAEKGITTGLDATHFGPDAACTRAQVVTFLHRSINSNPSQGDPLRVDRQPKSIVVDGTAVGNYNKIECNFDVAVVGGKLPYTYRWEYKENGNWISFHSADSSVATYGNSATTASLIAQFTPKQLAYDEAKEVRCVITDLSGKTVTSQTAVASFEPLEIETHPADLHQQGVRTGYCFDVSAKGGYYRDDGYTYQWQRYDPDEAGWVFMENSESVSGARTESLKIITDEPDPDALYRCKITDDNGTEVFSEYARILPRCVITKEPANVTTLSGDTAQFSVTAGGGSGIYTYKWQVMLPGTSVFVDVAGVYGLEATGTDKAKLSVSLADDSLYEAKFRCVVIDQNGTVAVSRDASLMEEFNVKFRTYDYWNTDGALGKNAFELWAFASGGSGKYTYTWYTKSVPVGENMNEYGFSKTDDDYKYVSARARRNYVVVYKCVVSDGTETAEHEFFLQYANS